MVRYADHVVGEGWRSSRRPAGQGLEGIVAKHRRSPYEPGRRSRTWLKIKIRPEQELVVGGWTPGEGAAKDLGALVVGYYEGRGGKAAALRRQGRVGFTARRGRCCATGSPPATDEPPFDPPPPKDYKGRWGGELKHVVWVKPELVIRAELGGWTREGIVRQAAFKGIDEGGKPRPRSSASARRDAEGAAVEATPRRQRRSRRKMPARDAEEGRQPATAKVREEAPAARRPSPSSPGRRPPTSSPRSTR